MNAPSHRPTTGGCFNSTQPVGPEKASMDFLVSDTCPMESTRPISSAMAPLMPHPPRNGASTPKRKPSSPAADRRHPAMPGSTLRQTSRPRMRSGASQDGNRGVSTTPAELRLRAKPQLLLPRLNRQRTSCRMLTDDTFGELSYTCGRPGDFLTGAAVAPEDINFT